MSERLTYRGTGVDYDAMDPFKRAAQLAGRETAYQLKRFGFEEVEWSRGESAYLIETPWGYLAHVEEGLGTKNLVADTMHQLTGVAYDDKVAQDTVAMIVNDMITLGALPLSVEMHLAVGSSDWFKQEGRTQKLIDGWKQACLMAECSWGGGETSTLKGIIDPTTYVLSGSALGIIKPKERLIQGNIGDGDVIVLLESSGIHANGLTMARAIAELLPNGYWTFLPDDRPSRSYGVTLLDPTHIYVGFIKDCLNAGIEIHYTVNITGHGWRKLMRAPESFVYVIDRLPRQQSIFSFIKEHGHVSDEEMYSTFNMGAGFALFVPEKEVQNMLDLYQRGYGRYPFRTPVVAGHIEKGPEKKVVILPKGIKFSADSLAIR